mgnify:CR=1 FL=1
MLTIWFIGVFVYIILHQIAIICLISRGGKK